MRVIHGAKVAPCGIPPSKTNNFISNNPTIVWNLKYFIILQMIFGINRIYSFKGVNFAGILSYIYSLLLMVTIVFFLFHIEQVNATYIVYKITICIEYLLLAFCAMFFQKRKIISFFENISVFDKVLRVEGSISLTNPISESIFWIILGVFIDGIEFCMLLHFSFYKNEFWYPLIYIAFVAHDSEIVFFSLLIKSILRRIFIIRTHICKLFSLDGNGCSTNSDSNTKRFEKLSQNVETDVHSLHKVYKTLHKSCEHLNSIMGFPVILLLFTSGLATTLLIRYIIKMAQSTIAGTFEAYTMIIYACMRCIKYTALVVIPCYFSSATANQVIAIRKMLFEAINTTKFDKIERRKLKAFFQLTKDSDFSYVASGIIKLDMSLPLSYCSLCTTYLVIILQFSKFVDTWDIPK